MRHWIRHSLLCRSKWTRKSHLWYGNVSEQYLLLCKNEQVYCACTRFLCMHNTLVSTQEISCVYTENLLCLHKSCVYKRDSCAITRFLCIGSQPWSLAPPVHAQECCACTRVLCMHKNLVHAQESCASTIPLYSYIIVNIALKHFHTRDLIFSFIYTTQ